MSDEFEVGHELDRALRAAVTGLAQIMERTARQSAERTRAAAAEARQEWLAHRDVARQRYVPWLRPGAVEESDPQRASRVWAVAAGWSSMDPMAKAAGEDLAERIKKTFGEHPSVLLNTTTVEPPKERLTFEQAQTWMSEHHAETYETWKSDFDDLVDDQARAAAADALVRDVERLQGNTNEDAARRLLTMPEALDLARERAPFYYRDQLDQFKDSTPTSDLPSSPAEQRLHDDWQHYSENGELPARSRWEAWAAHTGRSEEFDVEQWRVPGSGGDTATSPLDSERAVAITANRGELSLDQAARATAALDSGWEDGSPWAPKTSERVWSETELAEMHAALEAPTVDDALRAVGATPGDSLSNPAEDVRNRARMGEIRDFIGPAASAEGGSGQIDHEARDAALERAWDEGAEERGLRDLEDHQAAMAAAGMGELRTQVAPAQPPTWVPPMQEQAFDAATETEIAQAWRDARAKGANGDLAAQAAASQLGDQIRKKYGMNPDEVLIGAMTERAANNAETARKSEDKARRAQEAAEPITPSAVIPAVESAGRSTSSERSPEQVTVEGAVIAPATLTRERVVELNQQAQEYFAGNLRPGTAGQTYLVDRLGEGVIDGPWALGYAPSGWTNLTRQLQRNGATDAEILGAGLGRVSSRGNVIDAFRDRAMVGIRDTDGSLVGFVGRDLSGDERAPKYVNTGTTAAFTKSQQVFGLTEAPDGAKIVRAEGAFDAMAISLAGEGEAAGVAPMGTAMSDVQARKIADRAVDGRVWLANDSDKAGRAATETDYFALAQHGAHARLVSVPGSDPAAAWQELPGLMRSTMSTLDEAPTAGEVVIDRYIDNNADALAAQNHDVRRGLDDVVARVTETIDDPIESRLLAAQAERRRQELVRRSDEARTDGVGQDVREQKLDYAADHTGDPEQADRLNDAAAYAEQRSVERDVDGDRLEARAADPGVSSEAAYDRATESNLDGLSASARESIVVSSHGHSASTEDAIRAAESKKGRPAKPFKQGTGRSQGRTLRR